MIFFINRSSITLV